MQELRQRSLREQMLGMYGLHQQWQAVWHTRCSCGPHTITCVWGDGVACVPAGKAAEEFAKVGIVECMAFSSDGRILGVSTADGALAIYDWHTGRPLNVLRSASASVHSFKPLSRVCAAGLCC